MSDTQRDLGGNWEGAGERDPFFAFHNQDAGLLRWATLYACDLFDDTENQNAESDRMDRVKLVFDWAQIDSGKKRRIKWSGVRTLDPNDLQRDAAGKEVPRFTDGFYPTRHAVIRAISILQTRVYRARRLYDYLAAHDGAESKRLKICYQFLLLALNGDGDFKDETAAQFGEIAQDRKPRMIAMVDCFGAKIPLPVPRIWERLPEREAARLMIEAWQTLTEVGKEMSRGAR